MVEVHGCDADMPPWSPCRINAWKLPTLCSRTRAAVKGADQTKRAGCKGNVDGCMVTIACVLGYWLEVGAHCKNKKSILVENKVRNREDVI